MGNPSAGSGHSSPRALLTLSMKGGVGKTTTAIGLARALDAQGLKVGLLDLDIHGSSVPRALGLERDPGYEPLLGGRLRPVKVDSFQLFSVGLLFREGTPNMWHGEDKDSAVKQIVSGCVAWDQDPSTGSGQALDWLVVDTPPTGGDEVRSLLQHMPNLYGSVIVTQPNDLSLLGITRTLNMLRELDSPACGILSNMAGYRCPHCGQWSNPFDRETQEVRALAEEYRVPYLGDVPFGSPAERAQVMEEIVDRVITSPPGEWPQEERKGGVRRWLLNRLV